MAHVSPELFVTLLPLSITHHLWPAPGPRWNSPRQAVKKCVHKQSAEPRYFYETIHEPGHQLQRFLSCPVTPPLFVFFGHFDRWTWSWVWSWIWTKLRWSYSFGNRPMMKYAYMTYAKKRHLHPTYIYCDDERDHMDLFTFFAGSIKRDFDIGNK